MENKEAKKVCIDCGQIKSTLTDEGLCFACLAKQHNDDPDNDEGTWFSKG